MSTVAAPANNSGGKKGDIKKQVSLPFAKAFEFALKSIRIRFWRSMITAGGVFLGIAFLASVLTDKAISGANATAEEAARSNWLVGLSLLVCAVGITNSMLMSVTERFREIGTMKCLGALNQFVVKIFMIEACLMGIIASTLGWTVGTLLIILARWAGGVPKTAAADVHWWGAMSAASFFGFPFGTFWDCVLIGAALTVFATYIPAMQAARIPPAAALRVDV